MSTLTGLLILSLSFLTQSQPVKVGFASCFGDYQAHLSGGLYSGIGDYMVGEDFTYGTAMCGQWVKYATGSCYNVKCTGAATGGMVCKQPGVGQTVKVIDSLGANSCGNAVTNQIFDLSVVPFTKLGNDGGGCSGHFNIEYQAVSCNGPQGMGMVTGGVRVGFPSGTCDPWCPPFVIDNLGGGGAIYSFEVSPDSGTTWYAYSRNPGNGARFDCASGTPGGKYLGKALSFRITSCALGNLPDSCTAGEVLTVLNMTGTNWCLNGASPCTATSWQASTNLGGGTSGTTSAPATTAKPTSAPTSPPATTSKPTTAPTTGPATTAAPTSISVSCPAVAGTSYTAGASTNTVGKGTGFPSTFTIPKCTGDWTVPVAFTSAGTEDRYLVVDIGLSQSPWSWFGGGKCLIKGGPVSGTALVTLSTSTVPVDPAQITLWLVTKSDFDLDSTTAYQRAIPLSPSGTQVPIAGSVAACGTTSAPSTAKPTSAPTTQAPVTTTTKPTTAKPTSAPTTQAPVTTTTKPTTAKPTSAPTTQAPVTTTAKPTSAPTTQAPVTTTTKPTTAKPTSAPTTAPTTAPTNAPPSGGGLGPWKSGRASYYESWNWGNCGYGTIPSSTFPNSKIAAASTAFYNNAAACGGCYEVQCVGPWDTTQTNKCIAGKSTIIKITDQCPAAGNPLCADSSITHLDLSTVAFKEIGDSTMGVIKINYRRTSCLYTGPITITQEGSNTWYMKLRFDNVANWGGLSKVQIQNTGGKQTDWSTMTRETDNGWTFSPPSQFVVPLSVQITDDNGQVYTMSSVIKSIGGGVVSTAASNYKLPTSAAEATPEEKTPFMQYGIYILVMGIVIILLIVAIVLILRSRARSRGATVSEYIRASIAPGKPEVVGLTPVSPSAMSSQSELATVPVSQQQQDPAIEKLEVDNLKTPAAVVATPLDTNQEWTAQTDMQTGQTYYYNNSTGVTQWEVPDGYQA